MFHELSNHNRFYHILEILTRLKLNKQFLKRFSPFNQQQNKWLRKQQFPTTFSVQLQRTNDQSLKVNHASWSVEESFPCTKLGGCVGVEIYFEIENKVSIKRRFSLFFLHLYAQ